MAYSLAALRSLVMDRLQDPGNAVWQADDIDADLRTAYRNLATRFVLFWDQVYLENLPRSFSVTEDWEVAYLDAGRFDAGVANYTASGDRDAFIDEFADEDLANGPANYTSPFYAIDGWLSTTRADTSIPATAELPDAVVEIERATWDSKALDALTPQRLMAGDSRYQFTKGDLYGYTWQQDGLHTLRKIRVPAGQATCVTVNGSWGIPRNVTDLSGDTITGTWGIPRRIPGHFAMGPDTWGIPRRPYLDGLNVKVEVQRTGREMDADADECELPDRYALYLIDYAQAKAYAKKGPGQDVKLSGFFDQRWGRNVARIERRLQQVWTQRVMVLGGAVVGRARPPRPALPWPYGSRTR